MKTFFVRTRLDQALVGVFCAASPTALAKILEAMVEPADCEYLILKANEGLFVEAHFVQAPAQESGRRDTVFLTNVPDEVIDSDEIEAAAPAIRTGGALKAAMAEVIPPVLEPTDALMDRLQIEEPRGWIALDSVTGRPAAAIAPKTRTPILMLSADRRMH
jgi:hypothetical protein